MISYDPFDYQLQKDPHPTYEVLREQAPLYRNEQLDFWALSRHGDVIGALRDHVLYSSSYGVTLEQWSPRASQAMSFLAMDPPRHTRLRGLISHVFTPRRVQELEPRLRQLTSRYLAPLLEERSFDFIDLAVKVPVDAISELIGVPEQDRKDLRRWSEQVMVRNDGAPVFPAAAQQANTALVSYYAALVNERRRSPADDLTSALTLAEVDGDRLADGEIIAALMLLGVAGNETTARLLGNAWHAAWRHPDQRTIAFAGNAIGWVEETLRYDGPSQAAARLVTRDVRLHGATMPAGSRLLLLFAAANRDRRAFAQPDRFDVTRDTGKAIAFGSGRHFCLGASLARLEARVVLEELAGIVREDYDIDIAAARRARHPNVGGFATLPTTITPR